MVGKLQDEIRQTKPFASLETEALLALYRTADRVASRGEQFLKRWDVTVAQYNVLRILRGAEPNGLNCGGIGERMVARDPDITRLLDRLEKRGMVRRERDKTDRRVVTTRITAAGLALLAEIDGPLEEHNRLMAGTLGPERLRELIGILEVIRNQAG